MRVTHGACGKTWKQKGNKSGHCSNCHDTYYGITAFDAHQTLSPSTNEIVCERKGEWWADEDGQWHKGRRLTEAEKQKIWGRS